MESFTMRPGCSRRSFLKLAIAAGSTAAMAGALPREARAAEAQAVYPENFTFAIMSDIHYFSPSLYGDNADYTTAENSDRKMFRESSDILDKALADIVAAKPNMVIVPGDLTKDGELVGHQKVAKRFEEARAQLEAAGVDTQFYVINGNHDLNNHHGKDFSGGSAVDAERTTPITFKSDIWTACGYTDTTVYDLGGTADGSLSYVARPCPGLTLIVVDTCKYNVDAGDGTLAQETSGHISAELLAWVCDQARQARAAGDVVVAMQHHGIVPHFGYEPVIFGEYLVDDYENVARAYAEAGISAVFTGHMHANDIAAATYGDATIYDIETGSLVTYPSRMRMGSFAFSQDGENLSCTLTVDSHTLGQVTLDDCALTAGAVAIEDYAKERTLTVDSIQTMLGGMFVEPLLAQYAPMGIKAILASLLPSLGGDAFAGVTADNLNDALWSLITTQVLSSDPNSGIMLPVSILNVVIYYNAETGRIEASNYTQTDEQTVVTFSLPPELEAEVEAQLAQTPSALAIEPSTCVLYIDQEHFNAFLEELYAEIDAKALSDEGVATMMQIVNSLVKALLESPVDDTAHSLLGLVDYAYQDHLLGCETTEAWVETAISSTPDLLTSIIAACVNTELASEEFTSLTSSISINMKTLLQGDVFLVSSIAISTIAKMIPNVQGLLDLLRNPEYVGMDLGAALAGVVSGISLMGEPVPTLAQNALYTLCHDDNVNGNDPEKTDHDFKLAAAATIPAGGDDGDAVDKSALRTLVGRAGKVDTTGASQSAINEFNTALALANAVLSNPDATEEDVAAARTRLARAIKALEESKKTSSGKGDGKDSSSSELPGTGDPVSLAALGAMALGGIAAVGAGMRAHWSAANDGEDV